MITVKEADSELADNLLLHKLTNISLDNCLQRILQETVVADRDFPPFDRVMMDGIGVKFDDLQRGVRSFRITGMQPAGAVQGKLEGSNNCFEVMTGAMVPDGTDTVIRYEEVVIGDGTAKILDSYQPVEGQHIHIQGSDRKGGDELLTPGTRLSPAEVGVLATVGKPEVSVSKNPNIAIVATGDELVDIEMEPEIHQIRMSNLYAMQSLLKSQGYDATLNHVEDDESALVKKLEGLLTENEVIILSGGVSKGKFDFVPDVLEALGIEKRFHFVKQRPGKPFWFGRHKGGVVFGLPGNPVSSFVGTVRYVLPFLCRSAGFEPKVLLAKLNDNFRFKPESTYFMQVTLQHDSSGHLLATPAPGRGSGDLANLVATDAFLELPATQTEFHKGETFQCYPYR